MLRSIALIFVLFGLWLVMSGVYKPLVIGLGLMASVIAVAILRRMDAIDRDPIALALRPLRFLGYLGWLMVEIAKSNWAVTKLILSPGARLRQHLFAVPSAQKSELAQVMFANSITLTPGTISVECEDDRFWVHALDYDDATPDEIADMGTRVAAFEGGSR